MTTKWLGWVAGVALLCGACGADGSASDDPNATEASELRHTPAKHVPSDYVRTPNGFFHPSCVIELADDEQVVHDTLVNANGARRAYPSCAYEHFPIATNGAGNRTVADLAPAATGGELNGWAAWGSTSAPGAIKALSATWKVPAAPRSAGSQVVYFFPGAQSLEDTDTTILQPVLGWQSGKWTIASWNCCKNGVSLHSKTVTVAAGDTLLGTMTATNCNTSTGVCNNWKIVTSDTTKGTSTTLNTTSYGDKYDWTVGGVLEVYGVSTCSQLPAIGETDFTGVKVTTVAGATPDIAWKTNVTTDGPSCPWGIGTTGTSVVDVKY